MTNMEISVDDINELMKINPLAAAQLDGISKARRIEELEAQLAQSNGKEPVKEPVEA